VAGKYPAAHAILLRARLIILKALRSHTYAVVFAQNWVIRMGKMTVHIDGY